MAKNNSLYTKGSEWRKWDLHIHPKTYGGSYDNFIDNINKSEAEVVGINAYSTIKGYEAIVSEHIDKIQKVLFPVIEFRMKNILLDKNDSRLKSGIRFNFHIIFDNDLSLISRIKTWINSLECLNEEGKQDKVGNINILDEKLSFDYFKVIESIERDDNLRNRYLVWLPYDEYGGIDNIDPEKDKYFKLGLINRAHIVGSSNTKQINFFVWKSDKHAEEEIKKWLNNRKIPCIKGSDAHEIDYPFGRLQDENSQPIEKYCWIKADPTFEGLKQILYEPKPQDRVWIGSAIPYQKESYQIIKKIKFSNTKDFPKEIEFNQNLCSIIGGRSSGKSALLNYIVHAIDPELVEKELEIEGAGEGEEYHWENISIDYEVEWQDGFVSKRENSRKIIYLPQGYLFDKSKDPNEIKKRIEPILFKKFPDFEGKYKKAIREIGNSNEKIAELVKEWFSLSTLIDENKGKIKTLGDKESIKKEKKKIEQRIEDYKRKYSLSEEETKQYKDIRNKEVEFKNRIDQLEKDLKDFQLILGEVEVFQDVKLELEPSTTSLPEALREKINEELSKNKKEILEKVNKISQQYKEDLNENIKKLKEGLREALENNKSLLDKYNKKEELEKLMTKFNEYDVVLKNIERYEKSITNNKTQLNEIEVQIIQLILERRRIIESLKSAINELEQDNSEIRFDIDYKITDDDLDRVKGKVNMRDNSNFINYHEFLKNQDYLFRENPALLLKDIYSGYQKRNLGYEKEEVAIGLLTITETILFIGEMEGDRIGGFSETTMTPGRRALFLLKLILIELYEKCPLLIDQPEDNLDSKSIAVEIVPFLREKKKERQIIMVSIMLTL